MRIQLTLLLIAALTGCDLNNAIDPADCTDHEVPATADTLMAADVAGHTWAMGTETVARAASIDTLRGIVFMGGGLSIDPLSSPNELLAVRIYGFHGAGNYPMPALSGEHPGSYSTAFYACGHSGSWYPSGMAADDVTVASYDSVTREISGTFRWHGTFDPRTPGNLSVKNGRFHLVLTPF